MQIIRKFLRRIGLGRTYVMLRQLWREGLIKWAARSRVTTHLYYSLYSSAFIREQHAYLYGRMKYKEDLEMPNYDQNFMLRRNVHRLEKGLLMRPRRDVFAVDYIEETVDSYLRSVEIYQTSSQPLEGELLWAHDVLEEYFQVVAIHPLIDKSKEKFARAALKSRASGSKKCIPYMRELNQQPDLSYKGFLALSEQRRSVRWYLNKSVPRNLIDQAVTVAGLSPSACNRQPFIFRIFDDPELVSEISQLPMGTSGFSQNIPMMIAIVGRLRAYFDERDRHLIYVDGALAAMSFMFALETLGLSSCPINWSDVESLELKMDEFLNLEPDERPIMLISVGYPDPEGKVACSLKKPLHLLRRYNFE